MKTLPTFAPGDRVQFTGKFLRDTGQLVGGEGDKTFTVMPCACALCARGEHVAVDEPSSFNGPGENVARHIRKTALYRKGTLHHHNA